MITARGIPMRTAPMKPSTMAITVGGDWASSRSAEANPRSSTRSGGGRTKRLTWVTITTSCQSSRKPMNAMAG